MNMVLRSYDNLCNHRRTANDPKAIKSICSALKSYAMEKKSFEFTILMAKSAAFVHE